MDKQQIASLLENKGYTDANEKLVHTSKGTFAAVKKKSFGLPRNPVNDNRPNRAQTLWKMSEHVIVEEPVSTEMVWEGLPASISEKDQVLESWRLMTSKDPDSPNRIQRLYLTEDGISYIVYDAIGVARATGELNDLIPDCKAPGSTVAGMSTIYNKYLAAIRTKPFVILAGISGTGKSRLARQLARGCCPADSRLAFEDDAKTVPAKKPGNFEMIPVRPNWHDSSELVGYVTRITEDDRPQYVLTPFVKFLVKAMLNPDVPFVLCLDEMNLAPVEQYFAEYLSAIETREWIDPADPAKGWTTDVFVRFDVAQTAGDSGSDPTDNFVRATTEALLAGLGDGEAVAAVRAQILADRGLRIPRNLVVVGTVNMDETTCSFSRKVLDRAMTFELNETDGLYSVASIAGEGPLAYGILGADATRTQFLSGKDACESPLGLTVADAPSGKTLAEAILDALEKVNAVLEDTPFKIAYRSRNEILAYCLERTAGAHATLPQALDEAIGMKILSRIEGDDQRLTVYVRDAQGGVQAKPLLETLGAAIGAALRDAAFGGETGAEGCAKKLAFMSARLDGGFTNYFV